jgi:predicted alpha-1,6-mannanase (GH76 family)
MERWFTGTRFSVTTAFRLKHNLKILAALFTTIAALAPCRATCEYNALERITNSWLFGSGWGSTGNVLKVNQAAESFAWWTNRVVDGTWEIVVDVDFKELLRNGGETGTASLAFTTDRSQPSVRLLVDVTRHRNGSILVEATYLGPSQTWTQIYSSNWRSSIGTAFRLQVTRDPGQTNLQVRVYRGATTVLQTNTAAVTGDLLDRISGTGLRAFASRTDFTAFILRSPLTTNETPEFYFRNLASCAAADLLSHFWKGDALSGQIVNTWNGYTGSMPDARGVLWERAILVFALDALDRASSNSRLRQRVAADWNRTKVVFSPTQLEACGEGTANPACDDAGWSALMYVVAHRVTGDSDALARAQGLVLNAFNRWSDDQLGGGMWYRDARDFKSLYQTAIILAALRIYDRTGDTSIRDRALQCADWIEDRLLRGDGLYWCDYNSSGPVGNERPYDIHEAGSVTFLGGNMAMGVIHAWRFRNTSNDVHRVRAVRTAQAVYNHLRNGAVLLNDRDAWVNATFAADWVAEVLPLRGTAGSDWQLIRSTAESIATNARTADGHYGGSWSGPAEGSGSTWWLANSRPQQIMTSATSVSLIAAAALLERQDLSERRPTLKMLHRELSEAPELQIRGETDWRYAVESSSNFVAWSRDRVVMMPSVTYSFPVPWSSNATARFYRAFIYFDP